MLFFLHRFYGNHQQDRGSQSLAKARGLSKKLYPLTFCPPISADFRFKDQIRGTCGGVMDNIAEGFERRGRKEFIYHLGVASGELGELKSQLYRGLDNDYFTTAQFDEFYNDATELCGMIAGLVNYLNRTDIKGQKFKESGNS